MAMRLWRLIVPIVVLVATVVSPARAAAPSIDEPGTYLIELSSGRSIFLGRSSMVAWSPDSTVAAVAELGVEAPVPHLRLVSVPDGEARRIALAEKGEINHLRWAPDGSRLAFTLTRVGRDPGPALMVVDADSATIRQLVRGSVGELAWTPDSSGITAITLEDGGGSIVTFDAATGEVRETVQDARDASCQRGLAWSPDGQYLAYGGPGLREGCGDVGNWGIWTWERATRTTRQLFRGAADAPRWLASGTVVAMVSEPEGDDVPPLSIVRFAPDGSDSRPIAQNVPRMFPQPPRLIQVVGDALMFPISTCDQGEAHVWRAGHPDTVHHTPDDVFVYRPALGPDGRSLAYVRVGDRNELVVAPVGGGPARVLAGTSAGLQVGTPGPWDAGDDWSPDGKWIAAEVTSEQFTDCVE